MNAAGLGRLGELDHVAGALDVGDSLRLGIGGHVVDGRQVEDVIDAVQPLDVLVGDPQPALGKVADDADDPVLVDTPAAAKLGQPPLRALADQDVDGAVAFEQPLDQESADEAGGAGYEVAHSPLLEGWTANLTELIASGTLDRCCGMRQG